MVQRNLILALANMEIKYKDVFEKVCLVCGNLCLEN